MAINMIDNWGGFFLQLEAQVIGYWLLKNLGMNRDTNKGIFFSKILPADASNRAQVADLNAIQCYPSTHPAVASLLLDFFADISSVKSKSGKA
jgi:hypothetical protein